MSFKVICKKCGGIVDDNYTVCPDCGSNPHEPLKIMLAGDESSQPAPEEPKENKREAKEKRRKPRLEIPPEIKRHYRILIAAAMGLAVIVLIFVFTYTGAPNRIMRSFESGEYETAYSVYNEKYTNSEDVGSSLIKKLKKYISELQTKFDSGDIIYADIKDVLNIIKDMRIGGLDEAVADVVSHVETINASRLAYIDAQKYYTSGDYRAAIIAYKQVISEDTENYQNSITALTELLELYRSQSLERAQTLAGSGDVFGAIDELRYALEVMKNDKKLKNALDEYIYSQYEEVRHAALVSAAKYASQKNYASAIAAVKELYDDNANDALLGTAYNTYIEDYEEYALSEADRLFGSDEVFDSLDILDAALAVLTNNENLTEKRAYIEANMPTDLLSLTPAASTGWAPGAGSLKDASGEEHTPRVSYVVASEAEVTYTLGGEYRKIEGQIVPHRDQSGDAVGQVVIHADGVLVYSSPAVIKNTNKFGFSVDIENAQEITITVSGGTEFTAVSLILMDIMLF